MPLRLLATFDALGTAGVIIAAVAAAVAFVSYCSTVRNNLSQRLLDRYYEIFELAVDHPEFVDPKRTRKYETSFRSNALFQYESYARLCWSHARDVYDAHFLWVFFRRSFIRQYCNAFETYRNLHYPWLERNQTFVPQPRFHRFVDRCQWRDYVSPRTADELRWSYTEDAFLDPLNAKPDRIAEYVLSIPVSQRRKMTVADLGCGSGELVEKLSNWNFKRVIGVDYSRKMISRAKARVGRRRNVDLRTLDLRNLADLYGDVDVAFSTNSILPREPAETGLILREIAATLKRPGELVAILPAFDTVRELMEFELDLFIQRRRRHGPSWWPARSLCGYFDRWKAFHVRKRMSGWFGNSIGYFAVARWVVRKLFVRPIGPHQYADDGANLQRFILKTEIAPSLKEAGLEVRGEPERVQYDWTQALLDYGYGNFPLPYYADAKPPPNEIFDWFVVAKNF